MIGLIGLGNWGKNIFRNLHDMKLLISVCDLSIDKTTSIKNQYPDIHVTQDFKDLIHHPGVQGICIAIPSSKRIDIIKYALNKGKAIFIEKPFASSLEEAKLIKSLINKKNNIVMTGHILHFHPGILKLKAMIQENYLGKIHYIYSNRLNSIKMGVEKNVLWCFAPHDISIIRFLVELEPITIKAKGNSIFQRNCIDSAHIFMKFPNNINSHCHVSWINPFKEQKIVVEGSKAMAVFDDLQSCKLKLYPYKQLNKDQELSEFHYEEPENIPIDSQEPLRSELEHFAECVLHKRTPKTNHFEGYKVVEILEKAQKMIKFS